ncbi:MAG: recombinase family protein [Bacteriovoracaceae bacterium]|jgi:DNA invertase Pin-like site-specific DNA recombinase|nr:recombinase family protein [Bacteriovoracaceae bacterium]
MKRAAIYLRVSTEDQSYELQNREILAYISARGWRLVETYEDKASGTNSNRPGFKSLMVAAKYRSFDVLICWKLDRLFRSLKGMVTALQELSDLGVEFISLKDSIDMTTASGKLMTHILASFAEFEAALIKERVKAGLRNAKAKGKTLGRPRTIDADKVIRLRAEGLSLSQIGSRLGVTKSAVSKTLKKYG